MPGIAIYARKSTESDDRQVQSLPAQLGWAKEQCARLGEQHPRVYQEARSAKTPGRPEFARLMQAVEHGEVDTIVCYRADRLARNALDGGAVMYALEQGKLARIVTNDRTYLAGHSEEEFILTIDLGLSSKYSKDLSKIVKRGLGDKLQKGELPGLAPVGYSNVKGARERRILGVITVDRVAAPHIRELFALAATGNYSLRALTEKVHEWGLQLPRSKADAPRSFPMASVARILKNPFYYGVIQRLGRLWPGSHEPLISKVLFDRVQDVVAGRRVTAERPSTKSFPFTGLIRCALCGYRLSAYTKVKKSGRSYTYYVCTTRLKRRTCQQPSVKEPEILAVVLPYLHTLSITPTQYKLCIEMLHELNASELERVDLTTTRLQDGVRELQVQQSRLLDLFVAGDIRKDAYEEKKADYAGRLTDLEVQLTVARNAQAGWLELAERFFEALTEATTIFETAEPAEKRALLRNLGLELEATPGKLHVKAERPASIVLNRRGHIARRTLVEEVRTAFKERHAQAILA